MPTATASKEPDSPPTHPRVLVTIATYNEKENLENLIREIHHHVPRVDVLVVDDNSPDGTGQLAEGLAARDPRIHVLHRTGKLGLGTAILRAMQYAMEKEYDYFVTMDADFSHHPRYLPAVLAGMAKKDVMIGSRYIPGGGTSGWPFSRKFMSWGINIVSRLLLRLPAKDTSGGYRCYRVSMLRRVAFHKQLSRGYSFQQETLYRCRVAGARLGETPILFEDRRVGTSKVNMWEAVRSLSTIVFIGLCATFGIGDEGK